MANTNELDYSRKVADGERLELIMRQVASRFKLDGNVLAEALLDIHERLKAVEGATEELTSSDRWKAFKTVQLVKPSPSASGDTVTAIDTVAQDKNGEITATKKNIRQGTTSQKGIVQLSDATNSTSTTLAATANAVKTAYDLAASKQDAVSTDTDSSEFGDSTSIATGFGGNKIHLNVASRLWNYIKGKLGISSSGSSTKFLNEQGEWTTVTTPDVSGKADKVTGATAGDVATLDANGNLVDSGVTLDPSTNTIAANISGNATTATTASSTLSGTISADNDLNDYNAANRNYQCNATNASSVSNKPSGASGAFELEVIRGTGNTCVQVYYSRDNVNFNYIRKFTGLNDGTWTGWVKLIDSDDTVASATTAEKLGSANVGLPSMPIYLYGGTPMSIEGYFCRPSEDPSTRNLLPNTTLNAVGGRKYVYNVSTSNTFTLTLASTATVPIAFVVRLKATANCPNVNVTYNDAVEKTTLTRSVYLPTGKMVDMCFTYSYGYFHLVSLVENFS